MAAASAAGTRRLSAYAREQFDRDPRRAWIVTAVAGAILLILVFVLITSFGGGDGNDSVGSPSDGASMSPAVTQPAGSAPNTGTAGTTPAAQQLLTGAPYSEGGMTSALQSRGLTATQVNEPFVCQNPHTTPKTYRVTAAADEQRMVLLVYSDAAAMNVDWVVGAGRPQYRNGSCAVGAAVIYFNQNLMMIFPQTTSAPLQAQIVDAFLTLP